MAVQERKSENTFDRYIAEVRATWGDGKAPDLPFKIKSLMEKLFASTSPEDPWMDELIREGKPSRELYRDPDHGFIQMGHVHKQGHGNTPHDHGPCWVVYGNYKNPTRMRRWRRMDDGSTPGYAEVELQKEFMNEPGMASAFSVGDIHSIEFGDDTFFIRVTGGDVEKKQTLKFDPDKKTVEVANRALGQR